MANLTKVEKTAYDLVKELVAARADKDKAKGRKLRKQLRRLGFYKDARAELVAKATAKRERKPKVAPVVEETPVEAAVETMAVN